MTLIRTLTLLLLVVLAGAPAAPLPGDEIIDLDALLERAESLHSEGSYRAALPLFRQAEAEAASRHDDDRLRWIRFRIADCSWRDHAAGEQRDTTGLEQARGVLRDMIAAVKRVEDRDRVWAEAQESLGDSHWIPQRWRNWHGAWGHYSQALEWWAASTEIDLARSRYVAILNRASIPPDTGRHYYWGQYGNQIPLPILEQALGIADNAGDRALLTYQLAMALRYQGGDWRQLRRVPGLFEAAIEEGRGTKWHDDAIFQYAQWLEQTGPIELDDEGNAINRPNYVEALRRYRQLVAAFGEGESRWYHQAQSSIRRIVDPQLAVAVSNAFLPGSVVRYMLSTRNVTRVNLTLTPIDLSGRLFERDAERNQEWLQTIDISGREPVAHWSIERPDAATHRVVAEQVELGPELGAGAYVLEARAGDRTSRALVLLTDLAVVTKSAGTKTIVYVCDALDGSPVAGATVHLWQLGNHRDRWTWDEGTRTTDEQGLVEFDLTGEGYSLIAGVRAGARQTIGTSGTYRVGSSGETWRVYTFSDRPAYRPGETARFKVIARTRHEGVYRTPSDEVLEYTIRDARREEVSKGSLTLNAFGSAWGELELDPEWTLGEYHIEFRVPSRKVGAGQSPLFRLEEYKLPEFTVNVETPRSEDGKRKVFVLGDTIEADIIAQYTFGGAVAGATVEVLVHQSSFWRRWAPPRPYGWLYEDRSQMAMRWHYGEQTVHRETLTTDESGRATVRFPTPFGQNQNFEYRIEARVTDASRREIAGENRVRVGIRSYFATLEPEHTLYRPGNRVTIRLYTRDANDAPVAVDGRITVVRKRWTERDDRSGSYKEEEVSRAAVTTNLAGEASYEFDATEEGYYAVRWFSRDRDGAPVRSETTVWVCDRRSRDVGYHHGGVQMLIDRDTVRAGATLPVMISVPAPGRHVLFTVEADGLLEHRLIHVRDRVRLIELEIDERFVPNVYLSAMMIDNLRLWVDHEELAVPPVEHFLEVELVYDRDRYLPRQDGTLTVVTRDVDGNPVSAEVALALVDKSVLYIQDDYAGDPRKFYFGERRQAAVQTGSSLFTMPFAPREGAEPRADGSNFEKEDDRDEGFAQSLSALRGTFAADAVSEMKSAGRARPAAKRAMDEAAAPAGANTSGGVDVQVRTDFRSTVLWLPDLVTGEDGRATVDVTFPESLTTWQLKARATTTGSRFGIADADVKTHQPVILRLQNPRFLVVGDAATISGIVRNDSGSTLTLDTSLDAEGLTIVGDRRKTVTLKSGEERRVDWSVTAESMGTAVLTARTSGEGHGDAMRRTLPVLEHGIDKQITRAARFATGNGRLQLDLPAERRPGSTSLVVQVTPSLAVTMLDALPYLIDYPYGCTEQTMSRFLPAAIVARTFDDLGLDPDQAMARVYGGIEQDHVDKTHPEGQGRSLSKATRKGLKRLYDLQHGDGGWGWWKEGDSDAWMTAYVVWGLSIAKDAGIDVRDEAIQRGVEFLRNRLVEFESSPDMQSFMLFALASAGSGKPHRFENAALTGLWDQRDRLNAYARALLALSANAFGREEMAATLVRNLENGVQVDDDPYNSAVQRGKRGGRSSHDMTTAHWGATGFWWRWSEGPVESTAFVLRAMLAIDPSNVRIQQATNWLIQNRRGAQWSNTRDTAIALLALTDYLRSSGEIRGRHGFTVKFNDRVVDRVMLEGSELIAAPSRFEIDPAWVRNGVNTVEVERIAGEGPLYASATAAFFSLEEPVTPAGNQLFVRRQYNRIVARETLLTGPRFEKTPLADGGRLDSGDRVEVVLTIETKNDYEYLLFEDLKPAGLEAVDIRSGGAVFASELKPSAVSLRLEGGVDQVDLTGAMRWVYRELRDRKVALFIDRLPQGVWEIRYTLRAETPGTFHAMPLSGHAMYVPEIRANGAEQRLSVSD